MLTLPTDATRLRSLFRLATRPAKLLRATGFVIAYILLDRLGLNHAPGIAAVAPWDLSGGLAFGLLLVEGPWWGIVVFVADLATAATTGRLVETPWENIAASAIFATIYAVGARQLRQHGGGMPTRERDLLWLVIIGIAASLGRAICDDLATDLWGNLSPRVAINRLMQDWTGAFLGIAVVTPMVAMLAAPKVMGRPPISLDAAIPALLMGAVLFFILPPAPTDPFRYFYLLFLPQIWIAVRFGVRGAVTANLAVQLALIAFFIANPEHSGNAFNYQFRLLALVLSALFLGVAVSERRDVEDSLRQRQSELARVSRLSLAGEMAAALAHELNQPLQATIVFARSARRLLQGGERDAAAAVSAMDDAVAQAERAGSIIKALRRFVGKGETDRRAQSFLTLVQNATALTQAECARAQVRVEAAIERPLPKVMVDAVQVEQVLVNLVQNAVNALEPAPGAREVTITAWRVDRDMLEVEVRDNGPGLSADRAERIFDPFTEGSSRGGLGLGLVITRGLVEAHGGRLWLARNEPGDCAFRFTLPLLTR